MQTFTFCILHYEVHILGRVDCLIEFDDILMVKSAQNSDFSDRLLLSLYVFKLAPFHLFDRHSLASWPMNALFDNGIGSMADFFAKMVHIQILTVRCRKLSPCKHHLL